jgi:hypothetical protein
MAPFLRNGRLGYKLSSGIGNIRLVGDFQSTARGLLPYLGAAMRADGQKVLPDYSRIGCRLSPSLAFE